ncbi:hypothetical protein R1sor_002028 [Riccia sorocarpa]|uniref:No apical meristem-associated C-terminal domain-containing protein n=1 Tax=Riccia sorocarpa TaxID=122646 RepID=A0ABD3GZ96_9MARC
MDFSQAIDQAMEIGQSSQDPFLLSPDSQHGSLHGSLQQFELPQLRLQLSHNPMLFGNRLVLGFHLPGTTSFSIPSMQVPTNNPIGGVPLHMLNASAGFTTASVPTAPSSQVGSDVAGPSRQSEQFKNRSETLNAGYKSICDCFKKSGNGNYFEMSASERKDLRLPHTFRKNWIFMDSFMLEKPNVTPACTAESFDPLPSSDDDVVTEEAPSPASAGPADLPEGSNPTPIHSESTSKSNSGIKKRKRSRKSDEGATAPDQSADAVFVEREKLNFMKESETHRIDLAKEQVAVIRDNLCGALGLKAQSLDRIAVSLSKP